TSRGDAAVPDTTTVIVGAGHCGLAMSRCLAARSVDHVVLERGQVANSWRTQRWDSLRLLTPNWTTRLPGSAYRRPAPDGYPRAPQVIIALAAAGRDPDRYHHPETFDTARTDTSHLAFGHGIHHCLGARLARLEGLIALTSLHARFPAMRLAVPRSALRWSHGDGLVLRGLSELPVILGPPSPA